MAPRLSVVVASVNGLGCILECLEKLEALPERDQIEILVLDRRTDDTARIIAQRFPQVIIRSGLTGRSIPELRWMGMQTARGDWVAVIEDHCLVTPQWAAQILSGADSGVGVIGGPVENGARDRLLDWAFFLAEYGPCMPPLREGETDSVPGNNAAYRRTSLPLQDPTWGILWESFLQKELRQRGVRILLNPAMLIYHKKSFRLGEMLEQRFLYSRSFAAMRAARTTPIGRLFYGLASVLLPAVLLWRIALCQIRKRRYLPEFLLGLPIIVLFVLWWAAGEMTGYLAGPGNSLSRVE